jgi:hypothetical protein
MVVKSHVYGAMRRMKEKMPLGTTTNTTFNYTTRLYDGDLFLGNRERALDAQEPAQTAT